MQLAKLQLEGVSKENAVLEFDLGLNIIAGASDTGKSFAFECIDYALGATDIPDLPPEAFGYTDVLLEFIDKKSNQIVTLKRSLLDENKSEVYYIYDRISNISTTEDKAFERLSTATQAKKTLSQKLLEVCNCYYRNILKKKAGGDTEAFTFRKFAHLTLINETRIVQKSSPIYMGDSKQDKNSTKETSTFYTILSGLDYEKHVKGDSPEIKKAHLQGAVNELMLICEDIRKDIPTLEVLDGIEQQMLENQSVITSIETSLYEQRSLIEQLEQRHRELLVTCSAAERDSKRISDNLSKFRLLKRNYLSDIQRLEFIEQASDYTSQLVDVRCPICHSQMDAQSQPQNDSYYQAIQNEQKKLRTHLIDLESTIQDLEYELDLSNQKITDAKSNIEKCEDDIKHQSSLVSEILKQHEHYLEIRDSLLSTEKNQQQLAVLSSRIQELNAQIDHTPKTAETVQIKKLSEEMMNEFCKTVHELLVSWNFISSNSTVVWDNKVNDVIVSDKQKSTYGKGARAVINSAFILAVMEYCRVRQLSHPGFIVLDSPLTTYKEKDKLADLENEDVDGNIKAQFFRSLAKMSTEEQIIIFDNEIPPENLTNAKYQHFTGNKEIPRTGFIPQIKR